MGEPAGILMGTMVDSPRTSTFRDQKSRLRRMMREAWCFIDRVLKDIERKHLPVVAAGVSYYFLTSLVPALMLLTAALAYIPSGNAMRSATEFMAPLVPRQSLSFIERLLTMVTSHRTGLLSLGAIGTLWLASIGFKGIISGLDIVHEVQAPRRLWSNRALAFALTFAVGILLMIGVLLTIAGPSIVSLLSNIFPAQPFWTQIWPYLQWLIAAFLMFGAIELLYVIAPNVPLARRKTIPGAFVATVVLLLLSWGLGFYFHHFGQLKLDRFYGALATPFAFFMWMKWGAATVLVGAEVNVNLQHRRDSKTSMATTMAESTGRAA